MSSSSLSSATSLSSSFSSPSAESSSDPESGRSGVRDRSSHLVPPSASPASDDAPEGYVTSLLSMAELKETDFYRAVFAEFLATLFFVGFSIAGGIAIENHWTDKGSVLIVATLYHAVLILLVIYAFSAISGAHFNPAVSFALVFTQRITALRCVSYILAQIVGAIAGAAVIEGTQTGTGSQGVGLIIPPFAQEAFLMEVFCTCGLTYGLMASAFDPRGWGPLAPFAVAITVGVNILAGSSVAGAGVMNPARAWGPAVIAANFTNHWVYWAGPLMGGVFGATVYEYLFMQRQHARVQNVPSLSGDNHAKAKHD